MQFEESMKKIHAMAGHSQEYLDEIKQGTDCLRDAWYDEEQERLNDIFWEEDEQPTIGTPEEAYAVAMSLSDAEIERLSED